MKALTWLAAATALAFVGAPARAAYVFTPTAANATAEGSSNDIVFFHGDTHQQWIFAGSIFGSDPLQIDGVSFRFDSRVTNQFGNSGHFILGSNFKVTLATLAGNPSTTFADNLAQGKNVLSGSQDIPYVIGGPAGQTKPWGVQITFDHPYLYDPAKGDLVFDMVVPGQQNFGTFDAVWDPLEHQLISLTGASPTSTIFDHGPVARFDVEAPPPAGVPEPAAWSLMIVGFGSVGALLRRRLARPA